MEKSFGLLFFLRKSRSHQTGSESLIYVKITVDGESCELSTKRKCSSDKWIAQAGRMEGRTEAAKEINSYLDSFQQKIYRIKKQMMDRDDEITAEIIKQKLLGIDVNKNKHMLIEIFKDHNKQVLELIGKQYSKATFIRYETTLRHTQAFLEYKYQKEDLDITKLDYQMVCDFEHWFKVVRNCDHNTTIKYISNFRKIINRCIKYGWLKQDPFFGFSMRKMEVQRVPLTEKELNAIIQLDFSIPRLQLVKDIFVFCCFTGLAYIDVKELKRSSIVMGNDDKLWIMSNRHKTKTATRIPILPVAKNILEKYAYNNECMKKDAALPTFSNQKMNNYLKEIADACGIKKTLTFHIARHTFATTVTLSNGVPIETVSKMLGHKDLKTTQIYAKILDHKIGNDMAHLFEKYGK
ncbi:site-specific integrase [Pinibacter soli]|uniref:Site-specific integrase n=1 Tax=Pinibacter soli TaxID=3044211 RepID=A0ABT6RHB7_9BACT|nr:site-specific integrase [Pinibacter soli]MDI3321967.1 site-specific integrase [Pinibacter soli]